MAYVETVAGNITIDRYTDDIYYLRLPVKAEDKGLSYFYDASAGILFKNNTMLIPILNNSEKAADLILATENMAGSWDSPYARITGIELDIKEISTPINGTDTSAKSILYLKSIPDNAIFEIAIIDDNGLTEMINKNLMGENQTVTSILATVKVSSKNTGDIEPIGYNIISISSNNTTIAGNVSLFKSYNGTIERIRHIKMIDHARGMAVYQAIDDMPGTYVLVITGPIKLDKKSKSFFFTDIMIFGTAFLALIIALIFMARRLIRRRS
jgi:hypothetical protein